MMGTLANLHISRTDKSIKLNPFILANLKYTGEGVSTNDYGETVRSATLLDFVGPVTVTIVKSKAVIPQQQGDETPVLVQESYYLIAYAANTIPQGLRFDYSNGKSFETQSPEKVIAEGLHVYTRVPLKEITQ